MAHGWPTPDTKVDHWETLSPPQRREKNYLRAQYIVLQESYLWRKGWQKGSLFEQFYVEGGGMEAW